MIKDNVSSDVQGVLVGIHAYRGTEVSSVLALGHANDITYYQGKYYVVKGGSSTVKSNIIKKYDTNFKHIADYTFEQNVSCIAQIQKEYFFLGNASKIYLCKLDQTKKKFVLISTMSLPEKDTVIDGLTRQGMCYYDSYLYKVYGKAVDGRIRKNYIAKYKLNGSAPKFSGIALSGVYSCDNSDMYLFEVEGVDVSSIGAYVAVDKRKDASDHAAGIYKIGFYTN